MSAEDFWRGDPQLFIAYRTSFINKKKREMEEWDYKCWLQGLYNHDGNGKLLLLLEKFFGAKGNTKIQPYPSKPYFELKQEEKDKKKIIERNYKNRNETLICQASMKQAYLDRIKREKDKMKGSVVNEE